MAQKKGQEANRVAELLEKLLVVQLHGVGATQDQIARFLGKSKSWVNQLVKKIPKNRNT